MLVSVSYVPQSATRERDSAAPTLYSAPERVLVGGNATSGGGSERELSAVAANVTSIDLFRLRPSTVYIAELYVAEASGTGAVVGPRARRGAPSRDGRARARARARALARAVARARALARARSRARARPSLSRARVALVFPPPPSTPAPLSSARPTCSSETAATGLGAFDNAPLASVSGTPSFELLTLAFGYDASSPARPSVVHEPNSSRNVSPYAEGGASFFGLVAVDRDGWVVWYFNASNTGLHPPHVRQLLGVCRRRRRARRARERRARGAGRPGDPARACTSTA